MEVVTATPNSNGVPPFHNHDVREWSRIDSLSGVLERARLETDHWAANTNNSSHNYGKVVDSRARSNADGAIQQQARRQLEVFQSSVPGGRLQVIKSHTVSSSRWSSKSSSATERKDVAQHFTDLELPLNSLDLSSQKSKATVGRSVGRRPPSRPRSRDETSINALQTLASTDVHSTSIQRISRLCNQVHENAVKQTFGTHHHKPSIRERQNGDGVEIVEIESAQLNGHASLVRTRSTSSEDINLLTPEKDKQNKSIEDLEDLEQLQNWRRTSKIRRSLQFPAQSKTAAKHLDLPVNTGSVRKIREDLETGRRLNTALRGNNVDLEALDQILQSITTSSTSLSDNRHEQPEKEEITFKKQKRHSFVTVESLQEVKGRLRRTSSPTNDVFKIEQRKKDDDADDGIDTEELNTKLTPEMPAIDNYSSSSKVRTYVYGMEALMNKKPILATGSLESRTSRQVNGICGNRSEDWYNRRKSYGFEQVLNHHDSINSISKSKTPIDSSTDSGICRSSEIVLVPTINKVNPQLNDFENENGRQNVGNVKRYASIFEGKKDSSPEDTHYTNRSSLRDYEGTKISIPIVSLQDNYNKFNYRSDKNTQNGEIKRHSIAVDESKYVTRSSSNNNYRRTSLAITDKFQGDSYLNDCLDDDSPQGRRHKKVEFCKTEVHFAVDSGRINIVATDEKPPPTNNFRRRRRNSGTLYSNLLTEANKNGLPVLHFGDTSYEKSMFNVTDNEDDTSDQQPDLYGTNKSDLFSENTVTVSTNQSGYNYQNNVEEEKENVECETPKGILKNKPIKPKPYLLGDDPFCTSSSTDEKEIWGVKLKPVNIANDPPMWKSTVTLKNTLYDKHMEEFPNKLEDVEPFLNEESKHSEQFDNIRIISSQPSSKRSSWNDKIKQTEDVQKNEIKGYSTKVNIGDGNVTVIEDDVKGSLNAHQTRIEIKKEAATPPTKKESPKLSDLHQRKVKLNNRTPMSPVVLRRTCCDTKKQDLKTAYNTEKLSSPSLVGQNQIKTNGNWKKETTKSWESYASNLTSRSSTVEKRSPSPAKRQPLTYSPTPSLENHHKTNTSASKHSENLDGERCKSPSRSVLRNPRRSEMAYFGVKTSPSPNPQRKLTEHNDKNRLKSKEEVIPIYENIDTVRNNKNKINKREFDSSILDELTKAADQILQAVNGYAEETEKQSLEEEKKRSVKKEKLDTISETKSWKQRNVTTTTKYSYNSVVKPKLKHTSSTSSVESVPESRKSLTPNQRSLESDRYKKKSSSDSSSSRAATKARRLQRASSREALLQSHGSSSEDLPVNLEVPLRKPRLVRKTKSCQNETNATDESKVRKGHDKVKTEERVPVGALPTIRHKTAVSTIRSTAEKAQIRERNNRLRSEDAKRKASRNEMARITSTAKSDKSRNAPTKEPITHRISTANIKKCNKAETSARS